VDFCSVVGGHPIAWSIFLHKGQAFKNKKNVAVAALVGISVFFKCPLSFEQNISYDTRKVSSEYHHGEISY
jgi:hypothetical protein